MGCQGLRRESRRREVGMAIKGQHDGNVLCQYPSCDIVPRFYKMLWWGKLGKLNLQFSSVQSLSPVRLFATPRTAAHQASLTITNSWSLLKLMSIGSVMPSNHLILCCPLLLLPPVFPSIRVFSSESVVCIRWPKYWSFSFSISPFSEYSGLISFRMDWLDLLAVQGTLNSLLQQFKRINSSVLSFLYSPTLTSIHGLLEKPQPWLDGPLLAK